jgi:uncharacterized protein YecE (DUF72 family)
VPRKSSKETLGTAQNLAPSRLFAGTSGWAYPTWKPAFYPGELSAKKFLSFYASRLNSVEVNYTFRKLPTAAMIARWLAETPAGFRFSFKAPQRITHFQRLNDSGRTLAEFFDAIKPVAAAGKLGLILFQLPLNFKPGLPRLRRFLAAAPFRRRNLPPIAFEFRHPGWFTDETAALLARRNAAFCIAETDELKTPELHTASGHTCFRLRRSGGYTRAEISAFRKRFAALASVRDVYVYFRHEDEPAGALNAAALLGSAKKVAR